MTTFTNNIITISVISIDDYQPVIMIISYHYGHLLSWAFGGGAAHPMSFTWVPHIGASVFTGRQTLPNQSIQIDDTYYHGNTTW